VESLCRKLFMNMEKFPARRSCLFDRGYVIAIDYSVRIRPLILVLRHGKDDRSSSISSVNFLTSSSDGFSLSEETVG
jgi:hypothetical protein